jgi:para-nitrobenzyl esterase
VFGTIGAYAAAPMLAGLPEAQASQLTQQTQQAWIAFIRGEAPSWPMAPHQHILA